MFDAIEKRGEVDNTVIVFMSDHGEIRRIEVVRLDERDVSLGRGMMKIRGKGSREDWVSFSAVSKRRLWSCLLVRFYSVRPLFCRMLRAPPPLP